LTTIGDIAKSLGITAGTVSRALRSDPRVKEQTRLLVLSQADKMGYVPNRVAQHLARGKSDTIWILLASLEWAQERQFASACNKLLWAKGYRAWVVLHDNQEDKLKTILQDLASGSADGAMVFPASDKHSLSYFKNIRVPLLFIDRWMKGTKFPVITSNNKQGSRQLMDKVIREGIGFSVVLNSRKAMNEVDQDRQRGLEESCKEHNFLLLKSNMDVPPDTPFALYGNSQVEIISWLSQQSEGIMRQCKCILTWDQWLGATVPAQAVFVAKQNFEAMAQMATDILIDWIEKNDITYAKNELPLLEIEVLKDTMDIL
jgi:DNA-binding LacI/PurR family transcriptional regulator